MSRDAIVRILLTVTLFASAVNVWAGVSIDMVPVDNSGNVADGTGYGAVGYSYQIGKYEVTAAQYAAFLNAVAATDPYGLYSTSMWTALSGCKIQRSGESGSYTYSVASDYSNRPVNCVSWYDALRFVNWLQNGQGNGSTEQGTYTITGTGPDWTVGIPSAAVRATWTAGNGHWVLPSENEWYKAAYHKNDGPTGNYWDYPTGVDAPSTPGHDMTETTNPGNNANYWGTSIPLDSPYYTTNRGEFQLSDSAYGTYDQGGNVWEWNQTRIALRGGSFVYPSAALLATARGGYGTGGPLVPEFETPDVGFRVAFVPESIPGDTNRDGKVDDDDAKTLAAHWGQTGGWAQGDFNNDTVINTLDTAILAAHWGHGVTVEQGNPSTAVPEPTVLAMLACLVLVVGGRRARGENVLRARP